MTAAKEETASAPIPILLQTRIRGVAPENALCIGLQPSLTSTSRWGSWQIYDRTPVGRLVGLDYFGARYFSGAQGRFTSPDIPLLDQDPSDPQSWNLYSYVRNNPLIFTDPTGRCKQGADGKYHDSDDGPCVAPGGTSVTVTDKAPKERDHAAEAQAEMTRMQYEAWKRNQERNKTKEDQPLRKEAQSALTTAYQRTVHDLGCAGLGFVVGDAGAAGFTAGQPTIDKPFSQGGAPRTSPASEAFRRWTGGARGGRRLPAFEGGPGTGMPFRYRPTNSVGGLWGRWLPLVGIGFTALGAYEMNSCLSTTP
jgi:RHS repeat-associated protein